METERTCKQCGETKPLEGGFYRNKLSCGGYLNKCIECLREYGKMYGKTERGRERAQRALKKYNQTEYGREKNRERAKEWRTTEKGKQYRESWKERPIQMEGTRVCSQCSEEKPITEFYKMLGGKGNRAAHCKDCHYAKHKAYRKTPAGKAVRKKEKRDHQKELVHVHNRKARIKGAPGRGVTHEEWLERLALFGAQCYYCGETEGVMTRDHIEPLLKGGAHDPENLIPACKSCNSAKGPRLLLEWVVAEPERFLRSA